MEPDCQKSATGVHIIQSKAVRVVDRRIEEGAQKGWNRFDTVFMRRTRLTGLSWAPLHRGKYEFQFLFCMWRRRSGNGRKSSGGAQNRISHRVYGSRSLLLDFLSSAWAWPIHSMSYRVNGPGSSPIWTVEWIVQNEYNRPPPDIWISQTDNYTHFLRFLHALPACSSNQFTRATEEEESETALFRKPRCSTHRRKSRAVMTY